VGNIHVGNIHVGHISVSRTEQKMISSPFALIRYRTLGWFLLLEIGMIGAAGSGLQKYGIVFVLQTRYF
jgi:hypothetical protein